MAYLDIIRAWKDEEYRLSLSDAERALLPENPVGLIELADEDLAIAVGGTVSTSDIRCRKTGNPLCRDN